MTKKFKKPTEWAKQQELKNNKQRLKFANKGLTYDYTRDLSVVKLFGLAGTYKGHKYEVRVEIEFDPHAVTYLNVYVDDDESIDYDFMDSIDALDSWCSFAEEGDRQLDSPEFLELLIQILDAYIEGLPK
jgi:hypothetical protein